MFFKGNHLLTNLYDSHVHWFYTGQMASSWNLKNILHPEQILTAELKPEYFRGKWLTGFGWDETSWKEPRTIHRQFLDQTFKDTPVLLSRADGHASWINTAGLSALGFLDQKSESFKRFSKDIVVDETGLATGHLKESAHLHALFQLPEPEDSMQRKFLIQGAEIFNQAGFTHIRDMTSSPKQWRMNQELLQNPDFILHVEHWFVCEQPSAISQTISQIQACKPQENEYMKIRGIKVFADGSLGSETACLSHHYTNQSHQGQMIWDEKGIKEVLRKAWRNHFEVAFHSLGDQASHQIILWAREIYAEGIQGYLHLEHAEILRPETILNMKSLHVRCHLQPCHWWTDQKWLQNRIGPLYQFAFPWEALRKAKIPFSFGSDSPIESSDLFSNLKALEDSAKHGIAKLNATAQEFHLYPWQDSVTGTTQILNDKVQSISLGERTRHFT